MPRIPYEIFLLKGVSLMKSICLKVGIIFILTSSNGYALIGGQVYGGGKSTFYEYVDKNGKQTMKQVGGTEYGLSVHADPIPLVPFSFGLFARKNALDIKPIVEDSLADAVATNTQSLPVTWSYTGSVDGIIYGPEVMAWLNLKSWLPYLRASYILGKYTEKYSAEGTINIPNFAVSSTTTFKNEYDASGFGIGIGCQYRPWKLIGFTLEYSILTEDLKLKKMSRQTQTALNGANQTDTSEDIDISGLNDDYKKKKNGSTALLFGINVGI